MDPNALLDEIQKLCVAGDESDFMSLVWRVAELDEWLRKGGFLPDRWAANRD